MIRRRSVLLCVGLLSAGTLAASVVPNAGAAEPLSDHLLRPLAGADSGTFPGSEVPVGDLDARGPRLAPLPGAKAVVASLGEGVAVSWNQFGTPRNLSRPGGWLATGLAGSPMEVARTFLRRNSALVGLTVAQVDALEVVYDQQLPSSPAHVILLRQRAGGFPLVEGGLISIGVRDDAVATMSTSAVSNQSLNTSTARLTPAQAVLAAAKEVGVSRLGLGDLTVGKVDQAGFTRVAAKGLAQTQLTRLRALPTADKGLRLVYETDIQDVAGGRALAVVSFVDAVTGDVLVRRDAVDTAAVGTQNVASMRSIGMQAQAAPGGGQVSGSYTADACSDKLPLTVPAGTASIAAAVAAVNPANDITFNIFRGSTVILAQDLASSPEAGTVVVDPPAKDGEVFTLNVCPFSKDGNVAPLMFVGTYATSATAIGLDALPGLPNLGLPDLVFGPATFRAFGSNPQLIKPGSTSADDRRLVCNGDKGQTSSKDLTGCDVFSYEDASPLSYDVEATTGLPTFSTIGNNAATTNAQFSTSLTPGPPAVPYSDPMRNYAPAFTDAWHTSNCDPLQTVGRADINASIVNLFTGHNATHDFSYRLGLVEKTGALQVNNFGKGGVEGDLELGNSQNAAATNPTFQVTNEVTVPASGVGLTGRNNANQITLQDGVPGITNQYLFEPVAGFYGPCADGDLDSSIFLHEYTHAISNRLIAGPDGTLSGQQGRSMGESWSDLVAVEYLQAFDLAGKRGEDPFSVGAYATGDNFNGIRDYNLRPANNPLTYGEFGFDSTGAEVHADGEIWNAIQFVVREALQKKYDAQFPSTNVALQKACALGHDAAGKVHSTFAGCPGNRRWVQYLFDGMILQADSTPSFVDIKNNMLAADMMRTKGADQQVMADAFAARGLGADSASVDSEDTDPTPGYKSPTAANNANVTFKLVDDKTGAPVKGGVYMGTFHARSTAIATTLGGSNPDATAPIVKGTYPLTVQAPGYGIQRFTATFAPGTTTKTFRLATNLASKTKGASVTGEGGVRLDNVIDDSEATDGGFDGTVDDLPIDGRTLTVDLAGGLNTINKIAVSALHHPADPDVDGDFQGRLLGVHTFDLQASTDGGKTFKTVYTSPSNFFPVSAPRATAPNINLRTVTLPKPVTADHLRMVVKTNTCTGVAGFAGGGLKNAVAEALASSDCAGGTGSQQVTITELQAFGAVAPTAVTPPGTNGPVVAAPTTSVGRLPATGAQTGVTLLGLALLGLAGYVVRRRRTV